MDTSSGMRLGPYQVLESLGKGGMGEVYRAVNARLDRVVAVKVLPAQAMRDADRVHRFEQEAKAASALNHPNILTIYDFGEFDQTYFMAMEFVEGQTLRQIIAQPQSPMPRIVDIAAQCASGLAAAHAAGIVHRDIKPENIMVRPDGYVKILDFGLAKLVEEPFGEAASSAATAATALTRPGQIMGTWQYMSPEQARGLDVDPRTDIWSLGAVLYEMITGASPFAAPTMSDTLACILQRPLATLSSHGVDAPEPLERILARALAKDREQRYRSIHEMEVDLKQLGKELERGAAPDRDKPSLPQEPVKVANGRRLAFFVVAAALLVALLGRGLWTTRPRTPATLPQPPNPASVTPLPERLLSYSLLVQKMRNQKPYQAPFRATGREILEDGWKVRFDFSLPQAGSLYVLNDAAGDNGKPELSIVFPTPSVNNGSAQLMAFGNVQSGWLVLNETPGKEKFWIIWSATPVPELEQAREQMVAAQQARESDPQIVRDPALNQSLRALLQDVPVATATVDAENKLTSPHGRGKVVVSSLELEHR